MPVPPATLQPAHISLSTRVDIILMSLGELNYQHAVDVIHVDVWFLPQPSVNVTRDIFFRMLESISDTKETLTCNKPWGNRFELVSIKSTECWNIHQFPLSLSQNKNEGEQT